MGYHWSQIAIVLVLGLLFFGAKRLPEMGSAVGKTIREFQRSMREIPEPPAQEPAAVPAPQPQVQQLPPAPQPTVAAPTTPVASSASAETATERPASS